MRPESPAPDPPGTREALSVSSWARTPFRGYRHWGGVIIGVPAAIVGGLFYASVSENAMLAGAFCTGGILMVLLLSLQISMSVTARLLVLGGGLLLGLAAVAGIAFAASDPGPQAGHLEKLLRPLSAGCLCLLLGAGPLAVLLTLPNIPADRWFIRMLAGAFAAGLAALVGLIGYGSLLAFLEDLPKPVALVFALAAGHYVLFRLHMAILLSGPMSGAPKNEPETGITQEELL